jgi:FkbM family methyltransferase
VPLCLTSGLTSGVHSNANAEYAFVYFANKHPEAQIIAVEPELSNVEILRENKVLYPNIRVLQAAIWHRRTFLKIFNQEDEKWAFQLQNSECRDESMEAITIECIIAISSSEFIYTSELDIEGAEKEVFSSSQEWLNKIGILIAELDDKFKPGCSQSFYSAVSQFDFKKFHKGENIILVKDWWQHDVLLR